MRAPARLAAALLALAPALAVAAVPAGAPTAAALPAGDPADPAVPGGEPATEPVRFRDGDRLVEAERLGPPDPATGLAPLRVRWPAEGVAAPAWIGAEALVRVPDPALLSGLGVEPVRLLSPDLGIWAVRDPAGRADGLALAARLAPRVGSGSLLDAYPDLAFRVRAAGTRTEPPDDPRFGGQWYLDRIEIVDAWAIEDGEPTATIVVVDNGCDLGHPDLIAKLDPGYDAVDDDDDPSYVPATTGNEHGTACAGIVGADTGNGLGIAGTCPGCRVRCVRMLRHDDEPQPTSVSIAAFTFAKDVDAAVVSNSWGYVDAIVVPRLLAETIVDVHDGARGGRGAVVAFAAGNDDREVKVHELQGVKGVLCVGATNTYDEATSFTNYGSVVALAAPTGTLATDVRGADGGDAGDYTASFGGTSSACPVVAGVAGLLASADPEATSAELDAILVATTRPAPYAEPDDRGHDLVYGYGIVDPAAALRELLDLPEPGTGGAGGEGGTGGAGGSGGAPAEDGGGSDGGGCGCTSGGDGAPLALLGLLALAARRKRTH